MGSHRIAVLGALVVLLSTCMYLEKASIARKEEATRAEFAIREKQRLAAEAAAAERRQELIASCAKGGPHHMKASAEAKAGKFDQAFNTLDVCREHMADPEVKALYARAMKVEGDKAAAAAARAAAAEKRAAAAEKAARKKEGVRIGMTQQEVLDSLWGRPESVNRTTTARGTREQWVYGNGNYLYFENGILTTVQN